MRSRNQLLKLGSDRQMTAEEKAHMYGVGNPNKMYYREGDDGELITRQFHPDEPPPGGDWVESPAELGIETAPNNQPKTPTAGTGKLAIPKGQRAKKAPSAVLEKAEAQAKAGKAKAKGG